jgi:hypothetical protein
MSGTYLTRAATNYALAKGEKKDSAMGFFNGIFFGIFQMNQVIGNLIAGFILAPVAGGGDAKDQVQMLMLIFAGMCGASFLAMIFIMREESNVCFSSNNLT